MLIIIFAFLIKFITSMDPLTKDLLTPAASLGEKCGFESCPVTKEGWTYIHLVPHSHSELGAGKTFHEHFTGEDEFYATSIINMKRILDAIITELWTNNNRKFTLSNSELPYFFHWWSKRHPTVHRMVYELVRQGRLVFVGAGWGMPDEASTHYQALIDSSTYALRRLTKSFLSCGRPLVGWQADVFGHSREYTSLLAQMGFDGLFINPISFDDELIRMQRKALEFVWRGSDDLGPETDIYTHKLFDGYWTPPGFCFGAMCSDPLLVTSDSLFRNIDERVDVFIEMIRNRQAPFYNTRHVMVMMGQRMGYFNAKIWFENIEKLITHVNIKTRKENLKMHALYSTPACVLKAVQEDNPTLETKQDDFFPFSYNKHSIASGMYTSRPTFKFLVKQANVYLQITKQLQVLTNLPKNDKIVDEFMWIMGIVQDHNIISGAMRPYVHSYYTARLHEAIQNVIPVIGKAFNKIRGTSPTTKYYLCQFNISSCQHNEKNNFNILVYNPLAWPVTLPVRIPILNKKYNVIGPSGTKMKSVIMKIQDHIFNIPKRRTTSHELVFVTQVPPLGLISFHITEQEPRRKRALIKKISKNQQQKYFIRQVNNNRTLFEDEYEDYDTDIPEKVEFENESRVEYSNDYVVTPRNKVITSTELDFEENTQATENTKTVIVNTDEDIANVTRDEKVANNSEDTKIEAEYDTEDTSKVTNDTEDTNVVIANDPENDELRSFVTSDAPNPNMIYENESESAIEEMNSYYSEESNETFIRNKYIQINLDEYRKISSLNLSNGVKTNLDIQYYYYISDEGDLNETKVSPGAYIFRALDSNPVPIMDYIETKVFKSDVVEEIHCKYTDFASFSVKLYVDSPVVEVDWIIGPVPFEDSLGKEVFLRYTTDLSNEGVFYTDANARQTMKRIKDRRPMYEPFKMDHVGGNIYPVTSRIFIEDLNKNLRFTIFNDRSQGGSSIVDGTIDLMVHRRIFTDDNQLQTYLNETEDGQGVIVRGKHHLYLTKADSKKNRLFEKKFAKEIELQPQVFVTDARTVDAHTALKTKLPFGVHILSVELYNDLLLVRLENYLEKVDLIGEGVKTVYLKDLFANIKILRIVETTLSAHMELKDWVPLKWTTNGSFVKNFNDFYGSDNVVFSKDDKLGAFNSNFEDSVELEPQKIRTFLVEYKYVNN